MNTYVNGGVYEYANKNKFWCNDLVLHLDGMWYMFANLAAFDAADEDTETTINSAWIGKMIYQMNMNNREEVS